MEKEYNYDEIESYLAQTLSGDALRQFETKLAADTDLQTAIDLHQKVLESIHSLGEDQFIEAVKTADQELDKRGFFLNGEDMDAYYQKTATPDLVAKIERRKANDPRFAEELAFHGEMVSVIDEVGAEEDFLSKIKEVEQERTITTIPSTSTPQTAKTFSIRRLIAPLAAAASVLLLIGFFAMQFASNNYSNQALVSNNLENYEMPLIRSTDAVQNKLAPAIEAYDQGNYTQTIETLAGIEATADNYQEAKFYTGLSYFQLKNYKKAIPFFKGVAASNDIRFTEKADWHQLMAYLSMDDTGEEFQKLLNRIIQDSDHSYQSKATALKEQLDSFWKRFF